MREVTLQNNMKNGQRTISSFILLFLLSLFTITLSAEDKPKKFFPGCHEVGHEFVNGRLVLKPVQVEDYDQTLYFVHNLSYDRVKLQYDRDSGSAIYPLWGASLKADRWASFATDKDDLQFQCFSDYSSGFSEPINCDSVIEVCQFPRAKFAEHNRGNYWIPSNKSKYSTRNDAIRYGILLRW